VTESPGITENTVIFSSSNPTQLNTK